VQKVSNRWITASKPEILVKEDPVAMLSSSELKKLLPWIQRPKICRAISGNINLVNAAIRPSKHAVGHELLAPFPPLL
jgi:hypothetical protein